MATRQCEIFTTIHTDGAILPPDVLGIDVYLPAGRR